MTLAVAGALAAAAGGLLGVCLVGVLPELGRIAIDRFAPLLQSAGRELERVLEPLRRAGSQGVIPTDGERLRLQAGAGLAGLVVGALVLGRLAGVMLAVLAGVAASRALRWRRARYALRLDSGMAGAAVAIADALAGGHSARGALIEAPAALRGPIGVELRAVAKELEMGAETDAVLERLRQRARSRRIDLVVAAIRMQRRSGGGLAALLRAIAASIEAQERLRDEARAASAQARFTSFVVLMLPLAGLALAELAMPGMMGRMAGTPIAVTLAAFALFLQAVGVVLVRRIGRID